MALHTLHPPTLPAGDRTPAPTGTGRALPHAASPWDTPWRRCKGCHATYHLATLRPGRGRHLGEHPEVAYTPCCGQDADRVGATLAWVTGHTDYPVQCDGCREVVPFAECEFEPQDDEPRLLCWHCRWEGLPRWTHGNGETTEAEDEHDAEGFLAPERAVA